MALYRCAAHACTVSMRLGDPAECPVSRLGLGLYKPRDGQLMVDVEPSGCLLQEENRQRATLDERKFLGTLFTMKNFVPASARGLFDCSYDPRSRRIEVNVKVHCDFVMGEKLKNAPPQLQKGFDDLKPWDDGAKLRWKSEVLSSLSGWDNQFQFVLDRPGWTRITASPFFTIEFVETRADAHIVAQVTRIPPVDPQFFNCGGTFVGLDQIIKSNPTQASKAALTSESGRPVAMASQNLGLQEGQVVNYNVIAHEFGHMIGLPDEYENPVATVGGRPEDNAKVIHKDGAMRLARAAHVAAPVFGEYTTSIMSRGTVVRPFHYMTVWEALNAMTRPHVTPDCWELQ